MKAYTVVGFGALVVCGVAGVLGRGDTVEAQTATKTSCEKLAAVALPSTTIKTAQMVAAGAFTPPAAPGAGERGRAGGTSPFADVPAFCRVTGTITPVPASTINIEVWLPAAWNGTFQGSANGLWAGNISYAGMANVIRIGAATVASDDGHVGTPNTPPADWYDWQNHREQIVDFEWRSFHEATLKAKALIAAYYTTPLKFSYLIHPNGGGSRQTAKEIQQFPDDYDAVVTGGLATHQTHHPFGQQWVWQAVHKTPAHYITPDKYPAIHQAALDACDAKDGVKDAVILDPAHCAFDPGVLRCTGADAPTCLTAPQIEAARQIYTPPTTPDTKQIIFGPLMPGSELGWASMAGPQPFGFGTQIFAYLVFKQGENWDPRTLKFDSATVARADAQENQPMNSWNPDISRFIARGGKLMLIGGWNDTLIAPGVNVDYYELVMRKLGAKAADSVRLFMVPDMGHSPGRTGASAYDTDLVAAIRQWKDTGKAPDRLVFTHYVNGTAGRKVAVCAYPQLATYKGAGSTDDPASYACKAGEHLGWESKRQQERR